MTTDLTRLGTWPTPLELVPRLADAVGLRPDRLWLKRDDLVGLGGGGNKIRKLEHTLALAQRDGARVVVTSGAPQSNHARLTAAAAARLGLEAVLVLEGEPPAQPRGNLLLDSLLGARVVWAGAASSQQLADRVVAEAEALRAAGTAAEVIPFGGSSPTGARGYVEAAREFLGQLPDLEVVVTAVGSGGTMAGLVHALGSDRVLGVDTGAVSDPVERVGDLIDGLVALDGPSADDAAGRPRSLRIRTDQVGPGYAALTDPVRDAVRLVARTEGVVLDPVYTGRTAAGLIAAVADGDLAPDARVVLLHSGGLPGLFGHPDVASLVGLTAG